jgi:hypothetical protein
MENDDLKERLRVYERTRDGLDASGRSMAESYDRALLTLSSAFLGGSLALINQVVELDNATGKSMLYIAWGFFALTIVLTLASFVYGLWTLQPLRDAAERYYMKSEENARAVSDKIQRVILIWLATCGVSFGIGIALLGGFIGINVYKEATVSKKPVPPVWEEHGIPPGTFQTPSVPRPITPVPAPAPAPAPSAPEKKG